MNLGSENALISFLKDKKNIYIYGAGVVGQRMAKRFEANDITISGFVVSQKSDAADIMGYPVVAKEVLEDMDKAIVIMGAIGEKVVEMIDNVMEYDNISVITLPSGYYNKMRVHELQDEYNNYQDYYSISFEKPHTEGQMGIICSKETGEELFRLIRYDNIKSLDQWASKCHLQCFEVEYGALHLLPQYTNASMANMKDKSVQMYAATTHNDKATAKQILDDGIIPLQVGASLTDIRKGCDTDNTGDNISCDNPNYCECTGLYWIWKNTSGQDYVGLDHYRRRLKISAEQLEYVTEHDINMVLALPQFTTMKTKDYFAGRLITRTDWKNMQEAILTVDDSFRECVDRMDETWFYFSCNLCLMKRNIFDDYCSFAFAVANIIDGKYKKANILRNDRYMGYIFEVLLSLYVMKNYESLMPYCTGVEWVE